MCHLLFSLRASSGGYAERTVCQRPCAENKKAEFTHTTVQLTSELQGSPTLVFNSFIEKEMENTKLLLVDGHYRGGQDSCLLPPNPLFRLIFSVGRDTRLSPLLHLHSGESLNLQLQTHLVLSLAWIKGTHVNLREERQGNPKHK